MIPLWALKWMAMGLLVMGLIALLYGELKAFEKKHYDRGYAAMGVKHEEYRGRVEKEAQAAKEAALRKEQEQIVKVQKAEVSYEKKVPAVRGRGESERSRLRDSARSGRVPEGSGPSESCPGDRHVEEFLRHGEALTRLLERADEQRLALEACRDSWPR